MKDENFKQILIEKESFQISDDFDKKMLSIIKSRSMNKANKRKEIVLLYLFFVIALIFGLILVNQFVDLRSNILNNKLGKNNLVLIPYIFIILFLFEKVFRATLVSFGKEKFLIN